MVVSFYNSNTILIISLFIVVISLSINIIFIGPKLMMLFNFEPQRHSVIVVNKDTTRHSNESF